jgi:eukaryotic-like serine/threonine-protein kinase
MAIAKGASLGPYEIVAHLGSGGMGEVWRARDRRIGRDVAVKVLTEEFHLDDERLLRFEQEARAAGALNHPGLVTIYDVGTTGGSPYIVMELLEGATLRETIGDPHPTPMPVRRVIDYAIQLSTALAVAHEKGIIHRDLKPENIFITTDRRAKILDFGLAKLASEVVDAEGRRRTSKHLTSAGIVVGTPSYMSPEQVRAAPLDPRTDIFALGSVLYEMLSGQPAFEKMSAVETMHSILMDEPPSLETIVPSLSPMLAAVVAHCLEKNPRDRFQSASDLAFQLRVLPEADSRVTGKRAAPQKLRRQLYFAGSALALLGLGAGTWALLRSNGKSTESGLPRTYRQLTFSDDVDIFPTLAPDGQSFAYVSAQSGNRDIYVQRVDGRTAISLTADSPADDSEPAFSPDGSRIAFRSEREGGGIYVMGPTGESPLRLTDFGHNPAWSSDGSRLVVSTLQTEMKPQIHANKGKLFLIDLRTGASHALPNNGPGGIGSRSDALQPSWSPHGKRIAYWGVAESRRREIWTISPDARDPARTAVRVTNETGVNWNPVWSPDGRFLYFGSDRNGTLNLWRVAIDEETGVTAGSPELVALPAALSGHYTFSKKGELAFTAMARSNVVMALPFDPKTAATGLPRVLFGGSQEIIALAPSPDQRTIAFTSGGQEDLFLVNADGTRLRRLTNDPARDRFPAWSRDGKTLYWYSDRQGGSHIWSIRTDGSGLTRVTNETDFQRTGVHNVFVPDVSPDGKTLAVETDPGATALVHLDRPPGQRLEIVTHELGVPEWSPDGRHLLGYPLDANGSYRPGIALYTFATRRTKVLLDSGATQWLPDGKHFAVFLDDRTGIFDIETGTMTTHPLTTSDVRLSKIIAGPFLSRDGATVYFSNTVEHSDIWLARLETR